jgi:hypothetical protein
MALVLSAALAAAPAHARSALARQAEQSALRGLPALAPRDRRATAFLDPVSDLPRSNVQVACRRFGKRTVGCLMRAAPRRDAARLYLRYRLRAGRLQLSRIASARSSHMRWPRHIPANTTVPSVAGQTVAGSTLRATAGAWRNRPAIDAYDWFRCAAGGRACVSVSRSQAATHPLVAGESGATFRVSVMASNRNGSSVAVSRPTATIGAPQPGGGNSRQQPTQPDPPPWFVGDFETGNLSQWGYLGDAHGVSVVSSPTSGPGSRHAAKAETTDAPDSSVGGDASYVETGSFGLPWENAGTDAWFAMSVLLPSGSNPSYPGTFTPSPSSGWNMFMEWHVSPGIGASSPYVGVRSSHLVFRLAGGPQGDPQMQWVDDTTWATRSGGWTACASSPGASPRSTGRPTEAPAT